MLNHVLLHQTVIGLEAKTRFFNLSGHGHFDMDAYDSDFSGKLEDYAYPEEAIKAALERLPKVECLGPCAL